MSFRSLMAVAAFGAVAALAQPALALDPLPQIHGVIVFEGIVSEGSRTSVSLAQPTPVRVDLAGQAFKFETRLDTFYPEITQRDFRPFGQDSTFAEYEPSQSQRLEGFYSRLFIGDQEYALGDTYEYLFRSLEAPDVASFIVGQANTIYRDPGFPFVTSKIYAEVLSTANPFLFGIDQLYNFTYDVQPGDEQYGDFTLNVSSPSRASASSGILSIQRVSVLGATDIPQPPTTPVPEPAAWALLIGGFGLAGAMLRRRRALGAA